MSNEDLVVAAAAAGIVVLAGKRLLVDAINGWVWPVPTWRRRPAVISDGFHAVPVPPRENPHKGVDIMYRRQSTDDLAAAFPPDGIAGSTWHFMPPDIPAVAAHAGRLWSAGRTSRGYAVVIDHGPLPYATFYQHLSSLAVDERRGGPGGPEIAVGQPLGLVGGDVSGYRLRHLHFELWQPDPDNAVDPSLVMKLWGRVQLREYGEAVG